MAKEVDMEVKESINMDELIQKLFFPNRAVQTPPAPGQTDARTREKKKEGDAHVG